MPGWAGTEQYVLETSRGLRERHHDVVIACRRGSELERRATESGVPITPLEVRSQHDWKALPRCVRSMREGYDVVHTHSYRDYIVPAVAARIASVPAVVMTRHLPHPFRTRVTALACGGVFYHRLIAISGYIETLLVDGGIPRTRVTRVRNGVDTSRWVRDDRSAVREELGISASTFVLAAAGRLAPEKGFDHLVRATHFARDRGLDVACLIAGAGDRRPLEDAIRSDRLESAVHLLGFRRDIPDVYAAADVVVVPSVWEEPFGFAVIEAFAASRPVIASRVGGMVEIVTPETGYLVEPGRAEEIADAISELAEDGARRARMGSTARTRAEEFSLDACVRGIESVYADILGRGRVPHG